MLSQIGLEVSNSHCLVRSLVKELWPVNSGEKSYLIFDDFMPGNPNDRDTRFLFQLKVGKHILHIVDVQGQFSQLFTVGFHSTIGELHPPDSITEHLTIWQTRCDMRMRWDDSMLKDAVLSMPEF